MAGGGGAGEFATRSTARGARTIMARKLGIGILLSVTLRLYFLNSVRPFDDVVQSKPGVVSVRVGLTDMSPARH